MLVLRTTRQTIGTMPGNVDISISTKAGSGQHEPPRITALQAAMKWGGFSSPGMAAWKVEVPPPHFKHKFGGFMLAWSRQAPTCDDCPGPSVIVDHIVLALPHRRGLDYAPKNVFLHLFSCSLRFTKKKIGYIYHILVPQLQLEKS